MRSSRLDWLGIVPFIVFTSLFLLLPASFLFVGSFQSNADGSFTLQNIGELLSNPSLLNSYLLSIEISAVTAFVGGVVGLLMAYAVALGGLPSFFRPVVTTFSGVASNFAGVPLAFAFIATLGRVGLFTVFLKGLGIDLYGAGFSLYTFAGLSLTYIYFQFPLMILIILPSLDGLKREWREASENLGASSLQYWRHVALPVLTPALLGAMLLLFANAFGAYATASALSGGLLNLVTIQIGAQIRGDVLHNPGLGYALALGMVFIMAVAIAGYTLLQRRTEQWQQ